MTARVKSVYRVAQAETGEINIVLSRIAERLDALETDAAMVTQDTAVAVYSTDGTDTLLHGFGDI